MSWPDLPNHDGLGDGRSATLTDRPETVEALQNTVTSRVAEGHAIYPRGGGTALDYGGTPRLPGVAIDLRGLNRVVDYPSADMTITIEAGVTLGQLRATLAEKQQRLLLDAPYPDRATLGGIYATNTNASRRFGAGNPRDQIIGVSFVTHDGALVKGGGRVVKNVAGYDLPKLMTGSMGTLGVLTQMTLKVRPIPEASELVCIPYASIESLTLALERLNTSGTRPIAVDVFNRSGAQHAGESLGIPSADWVLVIGFEDNLSSVTWQVDRLMLEVGKTDVVIHEGDHAEPLWAALTQFQASELGAVSFVANLRPSTVAPFLKEIDPTLWAVQAHAGNGAVRGHAVGLEGLEPIKSEITRLRALAVADGGNLILSRCPTDWKTDLRIWGEPRPDWVFAERVKRALDPRGVMNPGRFVGTI
ncbi:FAD-binding oxidoreductase [Singulisphaera rosea]